MIVTSTAYATIDTRHRIKDPNSRPRQIRVIGLGAKGGAGVAQQLDASRFRGVEAVSVPAHWDGAGDAATLLATLAAAGGMDLAGWLQGTDLIFVVAGDGDDVSLASAIKQLARRANISITGILMQEPGGGNAQTLEVLRGATDMLIVTTNQDYIVGMLEELGA